MLAKASRDLADTGACRTFLVSDVELPADQSRVDQENQIVECLAMAGLTADIDGMVFDIDSEDSRDQRHYIRVIAQVNGDAEHNVKLVAEGLPHELALPFALPQIGGFSFGADSGKKANITRLPP
jgi:hypothetical protein